MNNKININLTYKDTRWSKVPRETFEELTRTALKLVNKELLNNEWEIDVIFTNSEEVKKINAEYRNKNTDTNVLSFEYVDWTKKLKSLEFLGDVIFSYDKISSEALERKINLSDHLKHLYIHSVLHLLGYDHQNDQQEEEMQHLEKRILNKYGIEPTY